MDGQAEYLQIGVTALRDPVTREYLPAVPLYIRTDACSEQEEQRLIDDIGQLLAQRMKQYMDGCREAEATA